MKTPNLNCLRLPAALLAIVASAVAFALPQAGLTDFSLSDQFAAHAVVCTLWSPEVATQGAGPGMATPCLADEPQRPIWQYGDPPPPPSDPAKPDVLKDPKYEDWLDKTGVRACDLDLYQTGSDIQRDPKDPVPSGQNKDRFCRNSAMRSSIAARPRPIRKPASRTGSQQTRLGL